jgi:hypothetical protein
MFQDNLLLYKRFIDDVIGILIITNPVTNNECWEAFKLAMHEELYGLERIASPPGQQVNFVDITISIEDTKIISTL